MLREDRRHRSRSSTAAAAAAAVVGQGSERRPGETHLTISVTLSSRFGGLGSVYGRNQHEVT